MKHFKNCITLVIMALMSGCTFHLSILSNNNILSTRSQATAVGDSEGLVEGGGTVTTEASLVPQ